MKAELAGKVNKGFIADRVSFDGSIREKALPPSEAFRGGRVGMGGLDVIASLVKCAK